MATQTDALRFTGAPDGGYGSEEAETFNDTGNLRSRDESNDSNETTTEITSGPISTPKHTKTKGPRHKARANLGGFANLILLEKVRTKW